MENIKLLAETIQSLGGDARQAFIWYYVSDVVESVLTAGVFTYLIYKFGSVVKYGIEKVNE